MKIFIIFLFALFYNFTSFAQSFQIYRDSTKFYQEKQDYNSALKWSKLTLEAAEKEFGVKDTMYLLTISPITDYFYKLGKLDSAVHYQSMQLDLCRNLFETDHEIYAYAINMLGIYTHEQGNFERAEALYLESLAMRRRLFSGDNSDLAESIGNLGVFYYETGNYTKAEQYYLESYEIMKRLFTNDDILMVITNSNLGMFYSSINDYEKADKFYQESDEMLRRLYKTDHPYLIMGISKYADYFKLKGDYKTSLKLLNEVLEMSRRMFEGDHPSTANILASIGVLHSDNADFKKAEPLLIEAMSMREKIYNGMHPLIAHSYIDLANFYSNIGNLAKSEEYYIKGIELNRKLYKSDHPNIANALNLLGMLYTKKKEFDKVEQLYTESLEMRRRIFSGPSQEVANSLNSLGTFYKFKKDYQKAESFFRESLANLNKIQNEESYFSSMVYQNFATLFQETKQIDSADFYFEKALKLQRKILNKNHPMLASTISLYCNYLYHNNKIELAEPLIFELITMTESLKNDYFPSLSESEKNNFLSTFSNYYKYLNNFVLRRFQQNPNLLTLMFNNQLNTKGMLLNHSKLVRSSIVDGHDQKLIELYNAWKKKKERLAKLYNLSNSELDKFRINLDSLIEDANLLEKQITTKSEYFQLFSNQTSINTSRISSLIKQGEAAIEVVRFDNFDPKNNHDSIIYVALILKKNDIHPEIVIFRNGIEMEDEFLNSYKSELITNDAKKQSYINYWAPIAQKLNGIKKIYLSPDGVFNKINVNALYNPKTKKYNEEVYDIVQLTSLKDMIKTQNKKNDDYVLFGNPIYKDIELFASNKVQNDIILDSIDRSAINLVPLPSSEIEVKEISKLLNNKKLTSKSYLGLDASEENLKQVINPKVLHLSTHGYFLRDNTINSSEVASNSLTTLNPLFRSMLFFTNSNYSNSSNIEDGILTAYEAQNLNLQNTEMVVLAACETGLGEIKNGEGVYGLQRAFLQAGAKSVMMSLWKINDKATKDMMLSFYKNWLSGKTRNEAFRLAKKEIRKKYKYPYYWASFVLIGD